MVITIQKEKKEALAAMNEAAAKGDKGAFVKAQKRYRWSCNPRKEGDVAVWAQAFKKLAEHPAISSLDAAKLAEEMYDCAPRNTLLEDKAQTLRFDYASAAMNEAAVKGDEDAFGGAQEHYWDFCNPRDVGDVVVWAQAFKKLAEHPAISSLDAANLAGGMYNFAPANTLLEDTAKILRFDYASAAMNEAAVKGGWDAFVKAQEHYWRSCDQRDAGDVVVWAQTLKKLAEHPTISSLDAANLAGGMYNFAPANTLLEDTAKILRFDYASAAMNEAVVEGDGGAFQGAQEHYGWSCDPRDAGDVAVWAQALKKLAEHPAISSLDAANLAGGMCGLAPAKTLLEDTARALRFDYASAAVRPVGKKGAVISEKPQP